MFTDHWLFQYAEAFCRQHLLLAEGRSGSERLKGRGHAPRRELHRHDPLTRWLPHDYLHPPDRRTLCSNHQTLKNGKVKWDGIPVALESHYQRLADALLCVGYDLERSRLILPEAYAAASAYFALHHEPIPYELAHAAHFQTATAALATFNRQEDQDLFSRLQS